MLRAGDLRHRITIQSATTGSDGQGGTTKTWATLATVWAQVRPISGREAVQAGQMTSTLTTTVTIRSRTDVTVGQRVVHGSRTLAIASVQDPDGRSEQLALLCSEVQDA